MTWKALHQKSCRYACELIGPALTDVPQMMTELGCQAFNRSIQHACRRLGFCGRMHSCAQQRHCADRASPDSHATDCRPEETLSLRL